MEIAENLASSEVPPVYDGIAKEVALGSLTFE
jgi:hypothetical protein